jgi:hypothetical protein
VQAIGRGERAAAPPPPETAEAGDEEELRDSIDAQADRSERSAVARRERADVAAGSIAPEDVARLKSALDDLAECERLLAALRAGDEPASA